MVCGDSHTSTHGAFGTLAFGIGTSEVEHVLATQTLRQTQAGHVQGRVHAARLPRGVTSKDMILKLIGDIGTAGGTGHVLEYSGEAVRALSMEGAHDDLQHEHRGRRARRHDRPGRHDLRVHRRRRPSLCAQGRGAWTRPIAFWRTLPSDPDADVRPRGDDRRQPIWRRR